MSYTNQEVVWEARSPQNQYGDFAYQQPVTIKARKQQKQQVVKTGEGKEVLSKSFYYVSPPIALGILKMDKLDGDIIMDKYEMCTLSGQVKMVRFITV